MNKGTIIVKPAVAGQKIHLEGKAREFLPDDGGEVKNSPYWLRRINDKSVVVMKRLPSANQATNKEK